VRSFVVGGLLTGTLSLLLAAAPSAATAPTVLDSGSGCGPALDSVSPGDCIAPTVAAYGGWAAWSRLDPRSHEFALVLRAPVGAIALAGVPERGAPFDVDLGPVHGGVAAVYSRCANPVTDTGCHIAELAPLGAPGVAERTLAVPGGGSLHEPAIWSSRLVFLRRETSGGSEDYWHPTARDPDRLEGWRIGSGRVGAVPLPVSLGSRESGWPRGLSGVVTGLTLNGNRVAYVTATGVRTSSFELSMYTLWWQQLGQTARLVDQLTVGEANVCVAQVLSPTIVGGWLYAYLHVCDPSGRNLDRWTRYALQGRGTQRATSSFIASGEEPIYSVVPDGRAVDWDDGAVRRLPSVSWRTIARPAPASFCSHSDLFC
jgi:hypothetical protein